MPHDPVGHEAAEGATEDAESRRIDPRIGRDCRIDPRHQISIIFLTPARTVGDGEGRLFTGATARVGVEDTVAMRGQKLELMEESKAILRGWPTVDLQREWITLPGL